MTSPEPTLPASILSRPAPLLGPTAASSLLVGGTCLVGGLNAWSAWHRLAVGADYTAGVPGIWVADLTSAEATGRTVATVYLLAMTAAALTLLVWLSRIRGNARLLGAKRSRRWSWVLGVWFTSCALAVVLLYLGRGGVALADLRVLALADTASAALQCAAGAVVVVVIRRVTRWQALPSA